MKKRSLKANLRRMERAGERLQGVSVSSDPTKSKLELKMLGIAERAKKEGIR